MKILKTGLLSLGAALTANAAHAWSWWGWGWDDSSSGGSGGGSTTSVPEIDVSAGPLALAALGVALLIVWERRRARRG